MTESTVGDRVIAGFLLVMPDLEPEEITTLTTNAAEWDSLASITLLATLEEDFGLTFTDAEVAAMTTFKATVETVRAALARDAQE